MQRHADIKDLRKLRSKKQGTPLLLAFFVWGSVSMASAFAEIHIEQLTCRHKRGELTIEHLALLVGEHRSDGGVVVEAIAQGFVDALVHPVLGLLVAAVIEIAVLLHKVDIVEHHGPYLLDAQPVEAGVGEHLGCPSALGSREQVERITEVRCRQLGTLGIVAIGLIDDDAVGHLHDAALDALQLVARACQLDEEEEVDHGVHGGLALTYTYRLHENLIEPSGLA